MAKAKKVSKNKKMVIDGVPVASPEPVPREDKEEQPSAVSGELVQSDQKIRSSIAELGIGGVTTDELRQVLAVQTEQRKVIKEFVQNNLENGTDYGKIHVMSKDKCPDQYNCKKDYHYSKPVLFKPGQEKLFSLFQITAKLERDEETYQMLPDTKNLVAYKCVMYRGEQIVGEGRGSATVGDKQRDVNATIKIAEKRARMDACLSLGFSEYFTQDLDDPDYKSAADFAKERAKSEAEARDKDEFGLFPRDPKLPIDTAERTTLFAMILKYGVDKYYVVDSLKLNGIEDTAVMTSGQARMLMGLLKNGSFKKPEQPVIDPEPPTDPEDEVVVNIDESDLSAAIDQTTAAAAEAEFEDPPLVVDDDLKEFVSTMFDRIGLSNWGKRWLFTKICGRPLSGWDKLVDHEWRKAYDMYLAIEEGTFVIPETYHSKPSKPEPAAPPEPLPRDFSEPTSRPEPIDIVQDIMPGAELDTAQKS